MDLQSAVPDAVLGIITLIVSATLLKALFSAKSSVLKERLPSFDFLKGVCILFIIMMHTKDIAQAPPLLEAVFWLAVPSFIFASGYLTSKRNPEDVGQGYFWKIWWRIGLPYAIFTAFWMFLVHVPLADLPVYLILGRANGGILYFIPILLSLYAIYPVLLMIQKRIGWTAFLLLALCFSTVSEYADLQYAAVGWDANPVSLAFFGRLLFVFSAGMCLSKVDMGKVMGWVPALAALCVSLAAVALVGQQGFHFFSYFFGPVAFSCLLLGIHQHIARAVRSLAELFEGLGRNSLVIYMTHTTILYMALKPLLGAYDMTGLMFFALVLVATALSYACSLIFMKTYRALLLVAGISKGISA